MSKAANFEWKLFYNVIYTLNGDNEHAKRLSGSQLSANCACAVPLIDGLGYLYAFVSLRLVAHEESDTG